MTIPEIKYPVSVVLVGIGGYGGLYVDELFEDAEKGYCTIVGFVDPAVESSPKYERIRAAEIPVYASLDAFYAEHTAELCLIAAPIQFHTPYSVCAMEHGSHVLCEKPLSGCYTDGIALEAVAEKYDKFVMSGYQWSHSDAILSLKRDILDGKFGKPKHLKTKILWPRRYSYFNRGSGWAGKRFAFDGTPIYDSVANNAAAHYLHNMLFVLGDEMNRAAEPISVDAELLRVNPIENFDTCAIRVHLASGADALFLATHATAENENPVFLYEFEHGSVVYDETDREIRATMEDGTEVRYGDPFDDQMRKVRYAIRAVRDREARAALPCTVRTAMPHAMTIYAIRDAHIQTVPSALTEILPGGADGLDTLRVVRGLHDALNAAYDAGCMLSECEDPASEVLRRIIRTETALVPNR